MQPPVLALFGPTGVGKTALALAVADRLRSCGEDPVAISADALQLYRGLEVLTGAATADERERLEHRLVGVLEPTETCSAGRYAQLAHAEVDAALAAGRAPLVLGGTGLYLRAALADLDLRPPPDPGVREALRERAAAEGPERLHAELPVEVRARVQPTDLHRVLRAHELAAAGTQLHDGPQLWTDEVRHPTRLVACTMDRAQLDARIEARIDAMLAAGAADEVRRAEAAGASETARKALGFRELLTGDEAAMRTRTRRYARRQLTWLRKLVATGGAEELDLTGLSAEEAAAQLVAD